MALLTLIKNPSARKLFGKRELKIIEKQLWGVKLTQSEKNRLSRDIRPKFQIIRELAPHTQPENLKKGSIVKRIIEDVMEVIQENELFPQIKEIILFGSFPENKMTFRSDIDIAVKFNKINLKEATLFRIRISGHTNDKADIQVYNILPQKIKKEIDVKGKTIWKKE